METSVFSKPDSASYKDLRTLQLPWPRAVSHSLTGRTKKPKLRDCNHAEAVSPSTKVSSRIKDALWYAGLEKPRL